MITLDRVLKTQKPYHTKTYQAVVELNRKSRMLKRKFRTASRAEEYARGVITRYRRACDVALALGQSQAAGNISERMPD